MKTLLALLAVAGLSGCAVYPVPAYETYGGVAGPPYVAAPPVYIYGGVTRYSAPPVYAYPRIYNRPHPGVLAPHASRPHVQAPRPGARDRDRDGIPNRVDRDRDGDGVRNRQDRRPNDPGRR